MKRFLPVLIVLVAIVAASGGGWLIYRHYYPAKVAATTPVNISPKQAINLASLDSTSLSLYMSVQAEKQQLDSLNPNSAADHQKLLKIMASPL